ncbi:MAG: J domain-containing protein [Deltaproteobacteria bacterium]|nr:J domain-containing protein [Deltaproteobacteria bacterium]
MVNVSTNDYYEDLQISPNADTEMIERVFRILAKRYHPDNAETGNAEKFNVLYKAYQVLSDPEKRAAFDAKYEQLRTERWKIVEEASQSDGFEQDERIRQGVLSLLYVARRQDALNPGMGIMEFEKVLGCPQHHMEFHLWYLKEKGWIVRTDTGGYAITADGVDKMAKNDLLLRKDRLLPGIGETSERRGASMDPSPDDKTLLSSEGEQESTKR